MDSIQKTRLVLDDVQIPVKLKISALWVAITLCYLYGDVFTILKPGVVQEMLDGKTLMTQGMLLAAAITMAIPSVMVFVSLVLKPKLNRWANVVLGVIYSIIMLITMLGAFGAYYVFLGIVETVMTATIVWYAWNWPKQQVVPSYDSPAQVE